MTIRPTHCGMKCGNKVENRCSSCNTINPADANFCRKCGGALRGRVPASSPSVQTALETPHVEVIQERQTAEGLDGERKTVTALFADLKGSTELMADLDPEEARAIIDPAPVQRSGWSRGCSWSRIAERRRLRASSGRSNFTG